MSVLMSAAVSVTTTEGTFTAGSLVYVTDDGDCCDDEGHPILARVDRVEEDEEGEFTACLTFIDGAGGDYYVDSLVEANPATRMSGKFLEATPAEGLPPIRGAAREETKMLLEHLEYAKGPKGWTLYGARRPFQTLVLFYAEADTQAQNYAVQEWPGEVVALVKVAEEDDSDPCSAGDVHWNDMRDPAFEGPPIEENDGDDDTADPPAEPFSEEWISALGPVEFI